MQSTPAESNRNDPPANRTSEAEAAAAAIDGNVRDRVRIAAASLRALLRNPDDTRQVFLFNLVLNARSFPRFLARFAAAPHGVDLLHDQPAIDSKTVDLETLRALPADTLG